MTQSWVSSFRRAGSTAAQVVQPVFSPPGGVYASGQSVSITSPTPGAAIYYTTNGTTPSAASTPYTGPVNVAATGVLQAIALLPGLAPSSVAPAAYVIAFAFAATPTFSPGSGTYTGAQNVTITCATPGSTIYYTTNGTTPTTSSPSGASPLSISVGSSETVQAIATAPGFAQSGVASAAYTIGLPQTATPGLSPAGGTYSSATPVTIVDATPGATIYYTTDGTTPTTSSPSGTSPVSVIIASTATLQAMATASGYTQSNVQSASYTIGVVAPPALKWNPGVYMQSININGFSASVTGANGNAGNGRNHSEIAELILSMTRFPGIFKGYGGLYTWTSVDGPTLGTYNFAGLISDANDLWAQAAAAGISAANFPCYAPNIQCAEPWNGTFSASGGSQIVPAYILNGGSSYGDAPSGANGNGWSFTQYNGGSPATYGYIEAALWNANTMARWISMWQALYATPIVATSGPYANVTGYTFGTHPLIMGFIDTTDIDIDMNQNPTVPNDYSTGAVLTQWTTLATSLQKTIPNVPYVMTLGYGPNSNANSSGTTSIQSSLLASLFANGGGGTCTDVVGDIADCDYAQQYIQGYTNTGTNSSPVWSAGGIKYPGQICYFPCWGAEDYAKNSSPYTPLTNACVEGLMMNSCTSFGAQYIFPDSDDFYYAGAWNRNPGATGTGSNNYGTQAYGSTGIAGAIAAFGGVPTANQQLPVNLMYGPVISSYAVSSATALQINWPAIPTSWPGWLGPNLVYNVFRSGAQVASVPASQGYFVDNNAGAGLAPGMYAYSLQMSNANGTGPVGPSINATLPSVVQNPTSLTWTPSTSSGVTGYNIGIRLSSGTVGVYPIEVAVAGQYTSYILLSEIIPPLANGTYFWAIESVGSSGVSAWSSEQEFIIT